MCQAASFSIAFDSRRYPRHNALCDGWSMNALLQERVADSEIIGRILRIHGPCKMLMV